MTPGTGDYLLETLEFQSFLDNHEKALWCPGMPGAGKTVITSYIVNYLRTTFQPQEVGIAVIYCNYKEPDQTAANLLTSLSRQLVQHKSEIPERIRLLHRKHHINKYRPSVADILPLLRHIAQNFSKTFVIVDALDEYKEQDERDTNLTTALQELSPDVHLLVTSRSIPFIESEFDAAVRLDIRASDENVTKYLKSQVTTAKRFQRIIEADSVLQANIVHTIIRICRGMFLMAKLQMDSLKCQRDRRSVRSTLENLPEKLDETYAQAMARIRAQSDIDAKIANCVLGWIVHATRPLTVREVQHALAVKPGQVEFDEESIVDEEVLVSVCLGLITMDHTSQQLSLVHFTAQKYLERNQLEFQPNPHCAITSTCLTYLSFQFNFNDQLISSKEALLKLVSPFALLDYAARNWGIHAAMAEQASNQEVLDF